MFHPPTQWPCLKKNWGLQTCSCLHNRGVTLKIIRKKSETSEEILKPTYDHPKKNWKYLLTSQRISTVCCSSCFLLMLFTKFATLGFQIPNYLGATTHFQVFLGPPKLENLMIWCRTWPPGTTCLVHCQEEFGSQWRAAGWGLGLREGCAWWWFQRFYVHPETLGNDPIWRAFFFQMGWNQPTSKQQNNNKNKHVKKT